MIAALASRAGKWPHEVLDLTPWQLGLALECWDAEQALMDRRIAAINGGGGMVFPVVPLRV